MFLDLLFAFSMAVHAPVLAPGLPDMQAPDVMEVDYILPAQRVVPYGNDGVLRQLSNVALSPDAQTAFDREFAVAPYFGAFAVSKDGGWGYSTGSNSLGAAREVALAECLSVNSVCTIHTELIPVGYVAIGPGDVTLSPETAGHYNDTTTNTPFFAMAVSADGAYSKVWGYASQAEADAQALADCDSYRITDLPIPAMPCVLLPRAGKK
jgi:hypothetical protein